MKLTRKILREMILEEKRLLSEEADDVRAFKQVGGDQPTFHDAAMDEALNDYVMQYVWRLEEDIGESRGTLALLEQMKEYLVDALDKGTREAMADSGVDY